MFGVGKSKNIVAVDIGSYAIKAVELDIKKKGETLHFQVARVGYETLPRDAIVEGTIIDGTSVSDALRSALNAGKITSKNVLISLSGSSVIVKKIALPQMKPEEMAESILWEAKHNIPYPFEETSVDYAILNPNPSSPEDNLDILLVAVKKEKITAYSNVVYQAQKNLVAVDVDGFGLLNCYEINYPELFPEKNVALVNLGAHVTNIVVVDRGIPQVFRDLDLGGFFFTENLSKEMDISFEEAEKLMQGAPAGSHNPEQLDDILERNIGDMLVEVDKTLSLHTTESARGKKIDFIFLSGGLAGLKRMTGAFERTFQTPTRLLDPFRHIHYNESRLNPAYYQKIPLVFAVAAGLATRTMDK
ncbi:MAG: type IV pilus assembly protein PilM [Candidatus Aminicenantes bacterium]|nr:type IV pilus assembly protein PilM [Candidatus Aminicenantes bacterium]